MIDIYGKQMLLDLERICLENKKIKPLPTPPPRPKSKRRVRLKHDLDKVHAMKRFKERYTHLLPESGEMEIAQYYGILNAVQNGQSIFTERQSKTRTKHLVRLGNDFAALIYSSKTRSIVTFLPQDNVPRMMLLARTSKINKR